MSIPDPEDPVDLQKAEQEIWGEAVEVSPGRLLIERK